MNDYIKTILITGCSSGIGFETALHFARNGYQTFASVRNINSRGARNLRQCAQNGELDLHVIRIDVTQDVSVAYGVEEMLKKTGKIDVLVNNAGFAYLGAIEDFSIAEIIEQYNTNIFGCLRMIKAVAPIMRRQKSGLIINISSINGLLPFPLYGVYSSSKYAIETLSEVLRFELHPFGIRVALVEPGSFITNLPQNRKHPQNQGTKNSPYKQLTDSFFSRYERLHSIRNPIVKWLSDPKRVAKRIYTIAQTNNPNLRNVVGIDANSMLLLKRILPDSFIFWLMKKVYQWE